jgi:hypothetical protein
MIPTGSSLHETWVSSTFNATHALFMHVHAQAGAEAALPVAAAVAVAGGLAYVFCFTIKVTGLWSTSNITIIIY